MVSRRRLAHQLLTGLVAVILVASCIGDYAGNGAGPKVAVLGDSLTAFGEADLHAALDPDHLVAIEGRTGATVSDQQGLADELALTDPDIVVVNLGTNDAWFGVDPVVTLAEMQAMITKFPSACIVLVTVTENADPSPVPDTSRAYRNDHAQLLNAQLAPLADELVDWNAAFAGHQGDWTDDVWRVHPNAAGYIALASLIAVGVDACATGGDPTTTTTDPTTTTTTEPTPTTSTEPATTTTAA